MYGLYHSCDPTGMQRLRLDYQLGFNSHDALNVTGKLEDCLPAQLKTQTGNPRAA